MVLIRLSRHGSKKRPFYYLTVADRRKPRDGRFIERVGHYNPLAAEPAERISVNLERVDYWLSVGGQASERVAQLVHNARLLEQGLPLKVRTRKPRKRVKETKEGVEGEVSAATDTATEQPEAAAEPEAEAAAPEAEPEAEVAAPEADPEAESDAPEDAAEEPVEEAPDKS